MLWNTLVGDGCKTGVGSYSVGQIRGERRAVCKLWSRAPDPDNGDKLHGTDEFKDPSICCCFTAERVYPQEEQQPNAGTQFSVFWLGSYRTVRQEMHLCWF